MIDRIKRAIALATARPTGNPYTCRLLIRADAVIYALKGVNVVWWKDGALVEVMPKGHGSELRTHFRYGPLWVAAARIQNRWPWTRRVLSA